MRKQNLRKVKWDKERNRAYVLRDGVQYWAPGLSPAAEGDVVRVFNPDGRQALVRIGTYGEIWSADATSPGEGG